MGRGSNSNVSVDSILYGRTDPISPAPVESAVEEQQSQVPAEDPESTQWMRREHPAALSDQDLEQEITRAKAYSLAPGMQRRLQALQEEQQNRLAITDNG